MSDIHIDTHEINDLGRDLATVGVVARLATAAHVEETARAVVRDARATVAVGTTGHLRDSIDYDMSNDRLSAEAGPKKPKGWYGHFVEGGTVTQPPRPYMGPALDRNTPPFIEGIASIGHRVWLGAR